MSEPRFIIQSLTGYKTASSGNSTRKPVVSWSVYDRLYNHSEVAIFFGVDAEQRASRHAEKLNEEWAAT